MPATSPPRIDEDLPLIQRAQSGDLDAFDQIVMKYQPLITGLLFRFAPQRADLEDLVQESFLNAWRGLPSWKPERPFVHWLKRVSVRTGLEFCRRSQRSPLARLEPPREDVPNPLENLLAEDSTQEENARRSLEEAQFLLGHLPADERALLTLLHLNEMPMAEIAGHFGWSRANTKIKAFRARQRLRKILKQHGYEPD